MRSMLVAALLGLALWAPPALAQPWLEEVRIGAQAHNILDEENKENDGVNVNAEAVFASPGILTIIGHPRPYLMVSAATEESGTTWYGGGLYWRVELWESGWAIEPGFGYVIHDGQLDGPNNDPDRILFGSRDLFRETLALEREIGPHFAIQAYFEHLSHGQILGSGRNQGTEEAGLRAIVRLKPQ